MREQLCGAQLPTGVDLQQEDKKFFQQMGDHSSVLLSFLVNSDRCLSWEIMISLQDYDYQVMS